MYIFCCITKLFINIFNMFRLGIYIYIDKLLNIVEIEYFY